METRARWLALAVIACVLPIINPHWEVLYYIAVLGLFALIGWAQLRVGTVGGTKFEREIPVSQVTAVEIKRGNRELMYVTEGAAGEGHVFIRLQPHQVPVELGWDAFSDKANRLAWMLGVPLVLPATKADGGGAPVQTTAN